jgi:diguanylate cyclase (GGDEF)-like protein
VKRYALNDAVVILSHESFGAQMFRAGGQAISVDLASRLGTAPGVYCDPDIVPNVERDAVRTACQLSLSLHLARFSAAHDALTNIANRRTFDSALAGVVRAQFALRMGLHLGARRPERLQGVNDSLGHAVGDDLLRQFGLAMRRSVRSGDVAARIGGDEFAVILSNADGHDSSGFTDRLRSHWARRANWWDSPLAPPPHHVTPPTRRSCFALRTPGSTRRRVLTTDDVAH